MIEFKNPGATVDLIVGNNPNSILDSDKIMLIKRKNEPYQRYWALLGGYLNNGQETLEEAGVRELREESHLVARTENLILLNNYSNPKRDPRGHVISHTYIVIRYSGTPKADDDASEVGWFKLNALPKNLAFDHSKILADFADWRNKNKHGQ